MWCEFVQNIEREDHHQSGEGRPPREDPQYQTLLSSSVMAMHSLIHARDVWCLVSVLAGGWTLPVVMVVLVLVWGEAPAGVQ